ncbi:hypothetical protein B566_EDAN008499 [Ephemera danica]|nr:hypothetical protein B566_EDAN008499 [Ephemera danica]
MNMKSVKCFIKLQRFSNFPICSSLSTFALRGSDAHFAGKDVPISIAKQSELRRNELFSKELTKQRNNIGRIEKIEVQYKGVPEDMTLIMNKHISTPFDCTRHMGEMLNKRSALARVNGQLWDLHRPLEEDCELELLHMKDSDPFHANKAFWRSLRSGSFVYDVDVDLMEWNPTADELRILSGYFSNLVHEELKFERLVVDATLAEEMFADNPHKVQQIPQIASQLADDNKIVLYRMGTHIDISRGPLIADTSLVGRCTVTAVHKVETDKGHLFRFQGVALPKGILLNHFAYGILEDRARKLNSFAWVPNQEQPTKS